MKEGVIKNIDTNYWKLIVTDHKNENPNLTVVNINMWAKSKKKAMAHILFNCIVLNTAKIAIESFKNKQVVKKAQI